VINKIGVFADVSNLYYCIGAKFDGKLDYSKYLDFILKRVTDGSIYRAYAYGAQVSIEADKFVNRLKEYGYIPRYKQPKEFDNPIYKINLAPIEDLINLIGAQNIDETLLKSADTTLQSIREVLRTKKDIRKADWDVGIAMDVVKLADRLDTVVIGSADGDLAPLVEWVTGKGCQCVVLACNISFELRNTTAQCIEINAGLLENSNVNVSRLPTAANG
jgi:uncharacterized LabA/DUF88 family protein